jgi:hypothetical protein
LEPLNGRVAATVPEKFDVSKVSPDVRRPEISPTLILKKFFEVVPADLSHV